MSKLLDQLKRHEGYRKFPYSDSVGLLTVGIGRNLEHVGISEEEAEILLANDVEVARQAASTMDYYESLSDERKDAVVNLIFNMGLSRFLGFKKMNAALYIGDYELAAVELLDSKYAVQVGDRARELASQIKTGEYAD